MKNLVMAAVALASIVNGWSNGARADGTAPIIVLPPTPVAPAPSVVPAAPVAPADGAAADALTVAVMDLRSVKGTEGIAKALTTLVTNEIGQRPGWKAISRNELKSLLAHQADQRLLGCEEAACMADVAKLVQAKRVVFGSVDLAEGGAAVFSMTLVDADGPTVLERVAYTWRSQLDDMVDLARPAVDRLVLGKKAEGLKGSVEILAMEGATVTVDDKELGATPLKPVHDLVIGPHHIEMRKSGYLPWGKDVAVLENETQVVQADLIDETSVQPIYARWYVWGSALAGVVVIGGTTAAVLAYGYLTTPSKLVVGGAQ